jgi:hypothetical protein
MGLSSPIGVGRFVRIRAAEGSLEDHEDTMGACMRNCLISVGLWVLGGAAIAGIVAYFLGISLVVGTAVIVSFPPGIVAALVAIAGVVIIGFLVALGWCYVRCARAR